MVESKLLYDLTRDALYNMGIPSMIEQLCPPEKLQKWLHVLSADQMILQCTRTPGTVRFIQFISAIGVVVNLVQVKKNVFSMLVNILNKQR